LATFLLFGGPLPIRRGHQRVRELIPSRSLVVHGLFSPFVEV
jgi:hypothetical protein